MLASPTATLHRGEVGQIEPVQPLGDLEQHRGEDGGQQGRPPGQPADRGEAVGDVEERDREAERQQLAQNASHGRKEERELRDTRSAPLAQRCASPVLSAVLARKSNTVAITIADVPQLGRAAG